MALSSRKRLSCSSFFEEVNVNVSRRNEVLERLQIFNQIVFLRVAEAKAESIVVAFDNVQQRREPAVMVKAAFVFWIHKQAALTYEDTGKVHGSVSMFGLTLSIDTRRRTIRFEAVDLHLV